jgi:hypothetical protein
MVGDLGVKPQARMLVTIRAALQCLSLSSLAPEGGECEMPAASVRAYFQMPPVECVSEGGVQDAADGECHVRIFSVLVAPGKLPCARRIGFVSRSRFAQGVAAGACLCYVVAVVADAACNTVRR